MNENFISLAPIGFNYYSISKNGIVRNDRTNFILKPYLGDQDYYKVSLSENGNTKKANPTYFKVIKSMIFSFIILVTSFTE